MSVRHLNVLSQWGSGERTWQERASRGQQAINGEARVPKTLFFSLRGAKEDFPWVGCEG